MPKRTPEQRFWSKVRKARYCWIWQGSRSPEGYGRCTFNGTREMAHRIVGHHPDWLNYPDTYIAEWPD